MSHRALERVYVRMLFDPSLVDAVYADVDEALHDTDLEPRERAQLVAVDRRAWGHDPLRRYRTLRTLAEELKCSTTLALAATRSLASLDAFFSAVEFHRCVQHRGSLALAFADYLAGLAQRRFPESRHFSDVLALERMLARCRRELEAPPAVVLTARRSAPTAALAIAPAHAAGRFNANVVSAMNAVEQYLFEVGLMPAVALCEDAPHLADLPPEAPDDTFLLALPSAQGISLLPIDEDYFSVLDLLSDGARSVDDVTTALLAHGCSADDARTMVSSLQEEGVLVPTASSRTETRTPAQ